MKSAGWMVIWFLLIGGGLLVLSHLIRTANRPPFTWLRKVLESPIGVTVPSREAPGDFYYRPYPRRLSLNWIALILGPVYYLLVGLWTHVAIMLVLIGLSGGLLAPLVWVYCGLKANEDFLEFRVASRSVY
jgi:hypothetical protein